MPSIQESKRQVKEKLDQSTNNVDHDAILANLQHEIDQHNAVKDGIRSSLRQHKGHESGSDASSRSLRFRFKSGTQDPHRRSKRRAREDKPSRSHHKRSKQEEYPTPPEEVNDPVTAHPFPREPIEPDNPGQTSEDAFRTSLFDALADDEGAAYWESVYSQPIHIYPRPTVPNPQGKLEQMTDEEYVDYVKTKMWERKNPEIVQERKRKEREIKLEEEERTRRREEFVRRRERAAWERAQRWNGRYDEEEEDDDDREGVGGGRKRKFEFTGEANRAPNQSDLDRTAYTKAWADYLTAWDKLKYDLLAERGRDVGNKTIVEPSKRIPWPVLPSKAVIRRNIEPFMQHVPTDDQGSRLRALKAERVRWHPDKVQQRFAGSVDERTMKTVTAVFQVVDGLVEEERKASSE